MSRQPYEKPQIIRHDRTVGNHFSQDVRSRPLAAIDGFPTEELLRTYGSPLFVFSERALRERAAQMRSAFKAAYPRTRFAWSYKTNSLDAICSILHQEGWHAEVVSELEYDMARRLGVPGKNIIFNGAYKPRRALERAIDEGAVVHIDHFDELDLVEDIAASRRKPVPVGIRTNMLIQSLDVRWDRFGFNLDNGEAWTAATRILSNPKLKLVGLHTHMGTQILLPEAYREGAAKLAGFARQLEAASDSRIDYLDLGGGFPSNNDLFTQFGHTSDSVPPIATFAEAVASGIRAAYTGRAVLPQLVLETGRALVDEAGWLLATVVGTRRNQVGQRGIVLDAGVNLLYTAYWYRNNIVPTRKHTGAPESTSVYGPLCMNIDVVRLSIPLPPLQVGHHVGIFPVGAYNVTQWMQFSQLRPNVILLCENGEVAVVRRAEDLEYLKSVERLPGRLKIDTGGREPER